MSKLSKQQKHNKLTDTAAGESWRMERRMTRGRWLYILRRTDEEDVDDDELGH